MTENKSINNKVFKKCWDCGKTYPLDLIIASWDNEPSCLSCYYAYIHNTERPRNMSPSQLLELWFG